MLFRSSDIHANLPAFEAALKVLDSHQPDAVYCLGDLVGYNVWPNEIIAEIRRRGIATIAGNHDARVSQLTSTQLDEPGKNYGYKIIDTENRSYLATLPAHIRIDHQLTVSPLSILLVHGSPDSNDEYLLEDKPEDEFLHTFRKAKADIICCGHSHKPYHRILSTLDENKNHFYHAINTGSVGKPKDGDTRGGFVMLTLHDFSSSKVAESIEVEFIRFEYEIERAAKAVEDSPLPNEFADMLRKAY